MFSPRRYWILLASILLAALVLRIAGAYWWQARLGNQMFGFPDSESYWGLAQTIAAGQPYQLSDDQQVFRTPGYPLLLAPLFWLGGPQVNVMYARLIGVGCGVLTVFLVAELTRRLFDAKTALAAALLAAVYPGAAAMSVFILAEAAFCPCMVLHLWLWIEAARQKDWRFAAGLALAGGMVAGLAILIRPSWLLFTPFAAGVALLTVRRRVRHLMISVAMVAGICLAMAPWWARNYRVTGHFVPTTLQVGASLYDGLHLRATGASDMRFVPDFTAAQRAEDAAAGRPRAGFEYRLDRRLRDAAISWARQNPLQVIGLAGVKFVRIWNIWPNFDEFRSWPLRLAVTIGYLPIMIGAGCGAVVFARRGWSIGLLCLPAVYFTGLHMIFVGSIRYRQPAVLILVVLAAAGWVGVIWPRIIGKPTGLPGEAPSSDLESGGSPAA